ncbi:myogenesis-regulating glycosidase-like [Argonauta hians]
MVLIKEALFQNSWRKMFSWLCKVRLLKVFLFFVLVLIIFLSLGQFWKRYMPIAVSNSLNSPQLREGTTYINVGHMSVDLLTSTLSFTDPLWVSDPVAAAAEAAELAAEGEEDEAGDGNYLRGSFLPIIKDYVDQGRECDSYDSGDSTASFCRRYGTQVELQIIESKKENHIVCYHIIWKSLNMEFIPQSCFYMDNAYWYGGPELMQPMYPIEKGNFPWTSFVPGFDFSDTQSNQSFGPIVERYWINSQGAGITIDNSIALQASMNDKFENKLCFKAAFSDKNYHTLSYTVCKGSNVRNVHDYMRKNLFENPTGSPIDLLGKPLWTTDEYFGSSVDQQKFLWYADKITKYGFANSQLQLDTYSLVVGDSKISPVLFPNSHQMIGQIKEYKLYTRLKVCMCASPDVLHFAEGKEKGFWLTEQNSKEVAMSSSQNGLVALIDFTNPDAVKWYEDKISVFRKDYGIQGFTFDFNDIHMLPFQFKLRSSLKSPADYLTKGSEFVYTFDQNAIIRFGFQSQNFPLFIETVPKNASWDYSTGLKNVIPNILNLGILGYPFIVPSAIGGSNKTGSPPASKELFIRWAQLVSYLPVMHFSIPPWHYDEETVLITKDLVKNHQQNIVPLIKHLMKHAEVTGAPIIRPIWWIAPEDPFALKIDCEFLVGDNLLVAPILDAGSTSRDIYLPHGNWKDNLNNREIKGAKLYKDFKVELNQTATFSKIKSV